MPRLKKITNQERAAKYNETLQAIKYFNFDELEMLKKEIENRMESAKKAQIADIKNQIAELQGTLAELEK